jgi:hypothetical protein
MGPGPVESFVSHGVADAVRIFDYPEFAKTVRDRAASLAAQAGVTIEHMGQRKPRAEAGLES